jgi:putative flippase GtrA
MTLSKTFNFLYVQLVLENKKQCLLNKEKINLTFIECFYFGKYYIFQEKNNNFFFLFFFIRGWGIIVDFIILIGRLLRHWKYYLNFHEYLATILDIGSIFAISLLMDYKAGI